jgi:hypothetical protein
MRQVVTLGDLVGRIERLEIRCIRCPRQGRVKLGKLLAEYGPDLGLPDLAVLLAAGCPQATATDPSSKCFVCFPGLVDLPPARPAAK